MRPSNVLKRLKGEREEVMVRFVGVFLTVLLVLFTLELTRPVQIGIVLPWTSMLASVSAWMIGLFDPAVISYGKVLQHPEGVGVSIEAGCNGVEACIILIAGITAYPAPWRLKLIGILIGIVAIQGVNVLRVITLFYLVAGNPHWFEFAHLYLWQALIMIDVLVVWLFWIRHVAISTGETVRFDDARRA